MIDDGRRFEHDLTRRGHYDQVWAALHATDVQMLGEHEFPGGSYRFMTNTLGEIGWCVFTEGDKPEFLTGDWFGVVVVAGRATTRKQALIDFLDQVAMTHPGRAR